MSSLKLALLTQSSILIKFIPDANYDSSTYCKDRLLYTFLPYYYKGQLSQNSQISQRIRQGEGDLQALNTDQLIYSGSWHDDLPDGNGKYCLFNDFYYEGQFKSGMFYQKGQITFKDKVIIKGEWQGFLLFNENWIECRDKINKVQIEEKYIISRNYNNQLIQQQQQEAYEYQKDRITSNQENKEEIMLSGEEFQILAGKKNVIVDEKSFDIFIQIVKPLQIINFQFFDENSLTKLSHILPNSPSFEKIQVIRIQVKSVTESEIVSSFVKSNNSQNLQEIDLSQSEELGFYDNLIAVSINQKEKQLKQLTKIVLAKCKENIGEFIKILSQGTLLYDQIVELDFSDSYLDNRTLEILVTKRPLKKLKRLILKNCLKINSEGMNLFNNYLANLNQIVQFDATGLLINSTNNNINIFKDQNIDSFRKFSGGVYQLQFLSILILDNANINDSVIEIITRQYLKNLQKISLRACSKLTQKSLLYLQTCNTFQQLAEVNLDFSNITLPKSGHQELWQNIKLCIVHCKQIEQQNLIDYLRYSKQIQQFNFNAKFLDQLFIQAINNNNNIKALGIKIDTYLEVQAFVNFIKKLTKPLNVSIENTLVEDIKFINEELQNSYNKKDLNYQQIQQIKIKGKLFLEYQEFQQQNTITKIKHNQFLNQISYVSAKSVRRTYNFNQEFSNLIHHPRMTNLKFLDLSSFAKNVDNDVINLICTCSNFFNLEKIDFSYSNINQKGLQKLANCNILQRLNTLILCEIKEQIIENLNCLIQSPNLNALKLIKIGNQDIEKLMKEILKNNKFSVLYFQQEVANNKKKQINKDINQVSIELKYSYIKNAKFFLSVKKGKLDQVPKEGENGTLKIKLTHFCNIQILNENNCHNLSEAIIELLKFKFNNKEQEEQQQMGQKEQLNNLKIVIIGQQLSGKKSLALKWLYDIQDISQNEIYSSPVTSLYFKKEVSIKNKEGEQEIVNANIWYFSGQRAFNNMQQIFYQDADAILVVFDLSSESLQQDMNLYLDEFKIMKYEKKIYFVGNKLDLVDQDSEARKFAKQKANEMEIDYVETSAVSGVNVNALFQQITEESYFTKQTKPKFSAEQLQQLGQIVQQFQIRKIQIKFNFLKSRFKISMNSMCEFLHKIQMSQTLSYTELILKNWQQLNKYEKEIIFLQERANFRIQLINQQK